MPAPTPDDLIASDPPPAFPPWMVEADPRLAAQETNRLYQAFRRRHLGHPRPWLGRMARWYRAIPIPAQLGILYGLTMIGQAGAELLTGTELIPDPYYFALVMAFLGAQLFFFLRAKWARKIIATSDRPVLPLTLTVGLYGQASPVDRAVTRDFLREVGASGREVAEALYLELRAGDRQAFWFILLFFGAGGFFPVVAEWRRSGDGLWPALALAVAWLAVTWRMAILMPLHFRPYPHLRSVVRSWQVVHPKYQHLMGPLSSWLHRDSGNTVQTISHAIPLLVVVAGLMVTVAIVTFQGINWPVAITLIIALAVVASLIPAYTLFASQRYDQLIDELVVDVDIAFSYSMGVGTTDDPDELRALLIREGKLGLDDPWPPKELNAA